MTEPRLGTVLTGRFNRLVWTTLAGYGLAVALLFAVFSELVLRNSLDHAAEAAQSLIGLYADPKGERTTVAPAMLADQLLGTGDPFLITRTVAREGGTRTVYFLSPNMPARRVEPFPRGTVPDSMPVVLVRAIAERGRWRYRILHRMAGEFDIFVAGSRMPYLGALGGFAGLALAVLPIIGLVARRTSRQAVGNALAPLARMVRETQEIGPPPRNPAGRATSPTGIGEVTELAEALNDLFERVERSHRALEGFTADASHELRTPLTHLRVRVQAALDERRSIDEIRQELAAAERALERMTHTMDDLLLLARGENRELALQPRPFALGPLVREVEEITTAMCGEKPVSVSAELDGDVTVMGDPHWTREILLNLASNSVRYTAEGRIAFALVREGRMAGVSVTDTGIGIGPEHHDRIFDRFYRVDDSRSRDHGGTGLGLTLARMLAELQGGKITVESSPGRGSVFVMWLPAAQDGKDAAPERA